MVSRSVAGKSGAPLRLRAVEEHPGLDVVLRYFDAVHRDPALTAELYQPDVVLHYSGRRQLSGEHRGSDAVQELFRQSREDFGGTQRLHVHDIVGGEEHVVALLDASAENGGRRVSWNRVVVFHVRDGWIAEQWILDGDQALVDQIVGS